MSKEHTLTGGKKSQVLRGTHGKAPRGEAPRRVTGSIRLLERALDLMEALERLRAPAGVRALEEITHIPRATVQRLLDVLEKRGYAQPEVE
jgi:hypothetical protein